MRVLTKCGDFKTNRTLLTELAKRNERDRLLRSLNFKCDHPRGRKKHEAKRTAKYNGSLSHPLARSHCTDPSLPRSHPLQEFSSMRSEWKEKWETRERRYFLKSKWLGERERTRASLFLKKLRWTLKFRFQLNSKYVAVWTLYPQQPLNFSSTILRSNLRTNKSWR